jgi:hypothetical protein
LLLLLLLLLLFVTIMIGFCMNVVDFKWIVKVVCFSASTTHSLDCWKRSNRCHYLSFIIRQSRSLSTNHCTLRSARQSAESGSIAASFRVDSYRTVARRRAADAIGQHQLVHDDWIHVNTHLLLLLLFSFEQS